MSPLRAARPRTETHELEGAPSGRAIHSLVSVLKSGGFQRKRFCNDAKSRISKSNSGLHLLLCRRGMPPAPTASIVAARFHPVQPQNTKNFRPGPLAFGNLSQIFRHEGVPAPVRNAASLEHRCPRRAGVCRSSAILAVPNAGRRPALPAKTARRSRRDRPTFPILKILSILSINSFFSCQSRISW